MPKEVNENPGLQNPRKERQRLGKGSGRMEERSTPWSAKIQARATDLFGVCVRASEVAFWSLKGWWVIRISESDTLIRPCKAVEVTPCSRVIRRKRHSGYGRGRKESTFDANATVTWRREEKARIKKVKKVLLSSQLRGSLFPSFLSSSIC
jgi:hypothetical protein